MKNITLCTYQNEIVAYFRTSNNGKTVVAEYYPRSNTLIMSSGRLSKDMKATLMTRVKDYIRNPANHYRITTLFNSSWYLKI